MSSPTRQFADSKKWPWPTSEGPAAAAYTLMKQLDHAANATVRTILHDAANPRLGCIAALEK